MVSLSTSNQANQPAPSFEETSGFGWAFNERPQQPLEPIHPSATSIRSGNRIQSQFNGTPEPSRNLPGTFQEPWNLPGAFQEPSRNFQEPSRNLPFVNLLFIEFSRLYNLPLVLSVCIQWPASSCSYFGPKKGTNHFPIGAWIVSCNIAGSWGLPKRSRC